MVTPLHHVYSIAPEWPNSDFGYAIPDGRTRRVICDTTCPMGEFEILDPDPLSRSWVGWSNYECNNLFGDFACAMGGVWARLEIAEELARVFCGLKVLPIVINRPKGKKGRILEDMYREIRPELDLPWNPEQSTLDLHASCEKCGRTRYRPLGVQPYEKWHTVYRDGEPFDEPTGPRTPGMGVFVTESELGGRELFGIDGILLCTEAVKSYVEAKQWTNIRFLEWGDVIPG